MAYFPFFVDLEGQRGLIVGGGTVALRKAEKLLPYGPALTVVAPEPVSELAALPVELTRREFQPEDLDRADFVIAATDNEEENHRISALCQGRKIPVNVVDDKEACGFLFPALVRRGNLSVGVSTGGSSPTAAIWLKEQIEGLLPEQTEEILTWLEAQRSLLKERLPDQRARAACFARLFAACLERGRPLTEEERDNV